MTTNDELITWLTAKIDETEKNLWRDSRRCASERRIIELHTGEHECVQFTRPDALYPATRTRTTYVAPGYVNELDPTLLLMASAYEDCPDEWKP